MKTHLIPASLNSASAKVRMLFAAMLLGSASLLVACGEPTNPAADYLATADSGTGTTTPDPVDPPAADEGDAANGQTLLKTCTNCHGTTAPGAGATMTILNKNVISKLGTALTGAQSATHSGYKTTHFDGQPRKDLEAALKLID